MASPYPAPVEECCEAPGRKDPGYPRGPTIRGGPGGAPLREGDPGPPLPRDPCPGDSPGRAVGPRERNLHGPWAPRKSICDLEVLLGDAGDVPRKGPAPASAPIRTYRFPGGGGGGGIPMGGGGGGGGAICDGTFPPRRRRNARARTRTATTTRISTRYGHASRRLARRPPEPVPLPGAGTTSRWVVTVTL